MNALLALRAFLGTRLGVLTLIMGVGMGTLVYGYGLGHQAASDACNVAALEAEIAALERDLRAAEHAREAARQFLEAEEARTHQLEQEIDTYVDQLEGGGACPVDRADLDRLRNLAGS